MARGNWMPRKLSKRAELLDHLDETLRDYKELLNIKETDLETIHNCNMMFKYAMKAARSAATFSRIWNSYLNTLNEGPGGVNLSTIIDFPDLGPKPETVPSNIFGFVRTLRTVLMRHKNYNESIGMALMFLGKEKNFRSDGYKPIIKATGSEHFIHFKTSVIDVKYHNVYFRLAGTEIWILGRTFMKSKFRFEVPITSKNRAEVLEVMLKGNLKNKEIGLASDIVTVIIIPKKIAKEKKSKK